MRLVSLWTPYHWRHGSRFISRLALRRRGQVRGNRPAHALNRERARTSRRIDLIVDERVATAVHLAYAGRQWQALEDLYHQASNALHRDIVRGLGRSLECPALFVPVPQEDAMEARQAAYDLAKLAAVATLTSRQRQVVILTGQGRSPTKIAHDLGMTRQSVEQHLARAIEKMRFNT